jgi:DNA-binding transcriptional regulator GbsR (MarR family)
MPPDAPPPQEAIHIAADTMAELIGFWGFKESMGRIWTVLYLSPEPLTADTIAARTGLSAGAVSMGLSDLATWGLVQRTSVPGRRKRHFRADTDIWAIVRRIVRERELRLVHKARERFAEAARSVEVLQAEHPDDQHLAFVARRLDSLRRLADTGHRLLQTFAEVGTFSLAPVRNALRPGPGPDRADGAGATEDRLL